MTRTQVLPLVLIFATVAGVCDPGGIDVVPEVDASFEFELGDEGWTGAGADLLDPPVAWSTGRVPGAGPDGSGAMRLFLDNANGAAKIWVQRPFPVISEATYRVEIQFRLGTSDFGTAGLWTLVTGVHASPPRISGQLRTGGQTGNGSATDAGVLWVDRSVEFTHQTGPLDSQLWIAIGVSGTSMDAREYLIDGVRVVLTRV